MLFRFGFLGCCWKGRGERERQRDRDRETDRQRQGGREGERDRDRENWVVFLGELVFKPKFRSNSKLLSGQCHAPTQAGEQTPSRVQPILSTVPVLFEFFYAIQGVWYSPFKEVQRSLNVFVRAACFNPPSPLSVCLKLKLKARAPFLSECLYRSSGTGTGTAWCSLSNIKKKIVVYVHYERQ